MTEVIFVISQDWKDWFWLEGDT